MSPNRIASLAVLALSALSAFGSAARADYQFTYKSFDAPVGTVTAPYGGTGAYGLSNSGAIVGLTSADGVTYDGYLRRPDGSYTTLNYPGSVPGDFNNPHAINNAGIVTGVYATPSGNTTYYIYNSNTNTFSSPAHPNAPGGTSYSGVNDAGQVAAQYYDAASIAHASIYNVNTGQFTDLPDIPASLGIGTNIQAINVNGDYIAAYKDSNGNFQGSVHRNGVYTSLMFPGAQTTRANSINSSGLIAGHYFKNNFANEGTFLYDNGTFYDIAFPGAKSTGTEFGFNDSNQIAGYYLDQNNIYHSFTAQATATPEPGSLALLIAGGLTGTAFLRRRNRKGGVAR